MWSFIPRSVGGKRAPLYGVTTEHLGNTLVVSILAPEIKIDLYNTVLNQITVPASILV